MQRDRLLQLLDRTADAAFTLTPRAEIWSWNRPAEELFGYRAPEALHRPVAEVLRPRGSLGRLVDAEYCERAIRDGQVTSFDVQVQARGGRYLWVNATVLVLDPLPTSPALIVHLVHDITGAKRREFLGQRLVAAARRIVSSGEDTRHLLPVSPLTDREQLILRGFADGGAPADVAASLGISPQTLRNHLHHINRKLGTHNRLQAVMHAIQRRLI